MLINFRFFLLLAATCSVDAYNGFSEWSPDRIQAREDGSDNGAEHFLYDRDVLESEYMEAILSRRGKHGADDYPDGQPAPKKPRYGSKRGADGIPDYHPAPKRPNYGGKHGADGYPDGQPAPKKPKYGSQAKYYHDF